MILSALHQLLHTLRYTAFQPRRRDPQTYRAPPVRPQKRPFLTPRVLVAQGIRSSMAASRSDWTKALLSDLPRLLGPSECMGGDGPAPWKTSLLARAGPGPVRLKSLNETRS
ncbi:unnamed protein product [Gadus morhua 'NCC']